MFKVAVAEFLNRDLGNVQGSEKPRILNIFPAHQEKRVAPLAATRDNLKVVKTPCFFLPSPLGKMGSFPVQPWLG